LLFAGDFYLRPQHSFQDQRDLFAPEIGGLVRQSAFSVVNFEGTLRAGNNPGIRKEGPHLALHHSAPALLKSVGFRGISLANNHAMDYGAEGLRRTLGVFDECGLSHAGAGFNSRHALQPLKVSVPGGVRIQILSLCEREFGVSADNVPGTAWIGASQVEDAIGRAKDESDIVVICAHGGNEFMPLPSTQRRKQLQHLIDAGADLVIGHHPHVPQGWEQYAGGYIFYSLGDFYFDDVDGRRYQYRDWGFMVRVHIEQRRIKAVEVIPYERVEDKVVPLGSRRDTASHLSHLEQLSSILADSRFEGYWQQLAVDRLSEYRYYLGSRLPADGISFRQRIGEILRMARDMWEVCGFAPLQQTRSSSDHGRLRLVGQALGALNIIRCESHRWAIETALAVLAGECEDLRSQEIKDTLCSLGPLCGQGYF
jgi:poly-gamma-glutamate synthesis protein (capsule biosynthesis protein)